MNKVNKWDCVTYCGAAKALGISVWKVRYAIDSGYLPFPSVVLKRRHLFSPDQVEAMQEYFRKEAAAKARRECV